MTASDVDGWDSLSHFNLVLAVEKEFGISVTTRDVRSMKNVGDLIRLIDKKVSQPV
jgi:acyl carrier protein